MLTELQRLRITNQYVDAEKMEIVKDTLSIRSSELDEVRAMLKRMAKELAASPWRERLIVTDV